MNFFKKLWYRAVQCGTYVGMAVVPWRKPQLIVGEHSFDNTAELLKEQGVTRPLVVCDKQALERHALDGFFEKAKGALDYAVYDGVLPNPTVTQVEEGLEVYLKNDCNGILAFGGGSVIDCAKIIGARAVCPKKTVNQLKGVLKVRKKLPPFFAVPTTAGTGSECTLAAVITDSDNEDKYAISDFSLIPHFAILDPTLTVGLPPSLTATTGMDALTHAVEAYIGHANTRATKKNAIEAITLIFDNLEKATKNGNDLVARANMQRAAYLAGLAFTRAYVGYVHALAHSLGGKYGTPHGLANAVLLPVVLCKYGHSAHKKLAQLADAVGVSHSTDTDQRAANRFIAAITKLNSQLGIPQKFDGVIAEKDVNELARHAEKEANPLYPVPDLWEEKDFVEIYKKVMYKYGYQKTAYRTRISIQQTVWTKLFDGRPVA